MASTEKSNAINVSTQCNMYMLNRPKTTSKGVSVILRDPKPRTKHSATQTKKLARLGSGPISTASSSSTSTASSPPTWPTGVTAGDKTTRSVQVQCRRDDNSSSTQTERKSFATTSTQVGNTRAKTTCMEQALYVLRSVSEFWNLSHEVKTDFSGCQLLIMSRHDWIGIYSHGIEPIRITLDEHGVCSVNKLFVQPQIQSLLKGEKELDIDRFMDIIRPLCSENLKLCPGVGKGTTDVTSTSCVVSVEWPFKHYRSKKCRVWFEKTDRNAKMSLCIHCKYSSNYMGRSRKRRSLETTSKKFQRRQIYSNYSFRNLTPMSKKIRLQRLKEARHYARLKVSKLEKAIKDKEMTLNNEQSLEMRKIVQMINTDHKEDLEGAFDSASGEQRKALLQKIWNRDSMSKHAKDRFSFLKDQSKFKTGEKTNRWSSITYRIALAVYCRSPAAYNALKSFHILQLPSVRSLQTKTSTFSDSPGVNHSYIKEQSSRYQKFKEEKRNKADTEPSGEGVLIFDEVKVIDKIMWNSKNHEFIGLAMTPDDFAYLNDIFIPESEKATSEPTAAKYMLQFVWRDLTSDFDVIGPYFSSVNALEHKFILGCVFETMRVFHAYDFKVKCLVCDGASENLAMIKTTMNHKGVFGFRKQNGVFDFSIQPSFQSPFISDFTCHWIICPSHQLKNMISALHSSREQGAKQFNRNGNDFGWAQLKSMKAREDDRFNRGQIRFVPGLTEAYILRDSWTRLNVKPSKIMQQEAVMSELYDHAQSGHYDSPSTLETYKYLKACNQLFENGLLSKHKVENIQSEPVQSILAGYKYFVEWLNEVLRENAEFNPNSGRQTKFLAWQTWDLLRICVFGVIGLVEDFIEQHPGYFLVLSRINGSVVESLFSQFKYATGSKLSSVNYAQARRSVVLKSNVHGAHPSNTDYRNVPLYVRESEF